MVRADKEAEGVVKEGQQQEFPSLIEKWKGENYLELLSKFQ